MDLSQGSSVSPVYLLLGTNDDKQLLQVISPCGPLTCFDLIILILDPGFPPKKNNMATSWNECLWNLRVYPMAILLGKMMIVHWSSSQWSNNPRRSTPSCLIGASFGMVPGARTFRFFTEAGLGLSPTENRSVKTGARHRGCGYCGTR